MLPRCMLQTTACVLADKELLSEKWDLGHGVEMAGWEGGKAGNFISG